MRAYLLIPFQCADLNAEQSAVNQSMYGTRITVEFIFNELKSYCITVQFPRKIGALQVPMCFLCLTAMMISKFRKLPL